MMPFILVPVIMAYSLGGTVGLLKINKKMFYGSSV